MGSQPLFWDRLNVLKSMSQKLPQFSLRRNSGTSLRCSYPGWCSSFVCCYRFQDFARQENAPSVFTYRNKNHYRWQWQDAPNYQGMEIQVKPNALYLTPTFCQNTYCHFFLSLQAYPRNLLEEYRKMPKLIVSFKTKNHINTHGKWPIDNPNQRAVAISCTFLDKPIRMRATLQTRSLEAEC